MLDLSLFIEENNLILMNKNSLILRGKCVSTLCEQLLHQKIKFDRTIERSKPLLIKWFLDHREIINQILWLMNQRDQINISDHAEIIPQNDERSDEFSDLDLQDAQLTFEPAVDQGQNDSNIPDLDFDTFFK